MQKQLEVSHITAQLGVTYPPCTEYRVLTECQRSFIWSAADEESLMRELISKGYRATLVMENAEYEREQQMQQLEFNWAAEREIEQEAQAV